MWLWSCSGLAFVSAIYFRDSIVLAIGLVCLGLSLAILGVLEQLMSHEDDGTL
jgi:hypothetical protein